MVVGEDVEEQLAPFMENCCEKPDKKYMKFNDIEDEERNKYENETIEKVVMPDGRLLNSWDKEFQVIGTFGIGTGTHKVPEGLEKREVPFTELFSSFEEYMKEWCGYEARDPETGRYGYWQNPNAKWDWYVIGGRWKGYFVRKDGTGKSDCLTKGEIDFEKIKADAFDEALEEYDMVEEAFGGIIPVLEYFWKDVLNDEKFKDMTIEEKRVFYYDQEAMKRKIEVAHNLEKNSKAYEYLLWGDIEKYQIPRIEFAANAANGAIASFAIVKDGVWHERGGMGWWGIVSDEKEVYSWYDEFQSIIDSAKDDELITLVDCHI